MASPCQLDRAFLTSVDWTQLDQNLHRLENLESVVFSFKMQEPQSVVVHPSVVELIKEQLGWLDQVGVLHVSNDPSPL